MPSRLARLFEGREEDGVPVRIVDQREPEPLGHVVGLPVAPVVEAGQLGVLRSELREGGKEELEDDAVALARRVDAGWIPARVRSRRC
jgi:hypothetical protein